MNWLLSHSHGWGCLKINKTERKDSPTSCLCPISLLSTGFGVLASRWRINRSLLPDDSMSPFHASAPYIKKMLTNFRQFCIILDNFFANLSQFCFHHKSVRVQDFQWKDFDTILKHWRKNNADFNFHLLTNSSCMSFNSGHSFLCSSIPDLNKTLVSPNSNQATLWTTKFNNEPCRY